MNRTRYFDYIEEKLGTLAYRINLKGKLNILDLHMHSENFYPYLLYNVFGLNLSNENTAKQNVEAIDLIDHTNKYICQVSATNTKQKVESALSKAIIKQYPGYTFMFICISNAGSDLRKSTFKNPHAAIFNAKTDIIDNKSILDTILSANIDKQKEVYEFIKKELGDRVDVVKLDSNLAVVINILSKENFKALSKIVVNTFEIDRKIEYNNLQDVRPIIDDYAPFYHRVDNHYATLDAQGSNKSLYVLQAINKSYIEECSQNTGMKENIIFLKVIDNVICKVLSSANYNKTPLDELEFCVGVLVVDAFIRCKIFKNPTNYNYAIA